MLNPERLSAQWHSGFPSHRRSREKHRCREEVSLLGLAGFRENRGALEIRGDFLFTRPEVLAGRALAFELTETALCRLGHGLTNQSKLGKWFVAFTHKHMLATLHQTRIVGKTSLQFMDVRSHHSSKANQVGSMVKYYWKPDSVHAHLDFFKNSICLQDPKSFIF